MVWQERGRTLEPQDDDEDRQTDNELHLQAMMASGATSRLEELEAADRKIMPGQENGETSVSLASSVPGELWTGGGLMDRSASYQLSLPPESDAGSANGEGMDNISRRASSASSAGRRTRCAASRINNSTIQEEPSEPATIEQVPLNQVYFTPASGDPPLLKLRAPEEEQTKNKEPCCGLM
ncbi:hypothetical protein WMY93_030744 [Mugilogobius chulae]|uniref:Uncharacterized protein n=1 Tax=Mugilogobius chulae TaxID=88201 RepID=A0AAW0MLL7_9GOBI